MPVSSFTAFAPERTSPRVVAAAQVVQQGAPRVAEAVVHAGVVVDVALRLITAAHRRSNSVLRSWVM